MLGFVLGAEMRVLFVTGKLLRVGCVPYLCPRCYVEIWRETLETGVSYVSELPVLRRFGTAFLPVSSLVEFTFPPPWWLVAIYI
jgi:hypothetical protein